MDNLILVNSNDEKIGLCEKIMAHKYGLLHRAFSIVIYSEYKGQKMVLLQQRAMSKYHGGGLWSNTCCSHFLPGKCDLETLNLRLMHEVGIISKLEFCGKFQYKAKIGSMIENEIDYVFVGEIDYQVPKHNPQEAMNTSWVSLNDLMNIDLKQKIYSPWLDKVMKIAFSNI